MKNRLKQLRKALDLTQTEFAERIGTVQNTINGYESGIEVADDSDIDNILDKYFDD